jgi:hypothetical protein
MMAVDVNPSSVPIQLGTPHALFRAPGVQNTLGPYVVTADGKKFLINTGEVKEENQPLTLVQNWPTQAWRRTGARCCGTMSLAIYQQLCRRP